MSAVFLSVGIIEVQIPFLSSAPPDKKPDDKSCSVKVDMSKDSLEVNAEFCSVEATKKFKADKGGAAEMHTHLVAIRKQNIETDKVQFFSDDDVTWKNVAMALDAIKLRGPTDPVFAKKDATDVEKAIAADSLFPKVVMASVILK
jgi:biopolymer transport protein ExbD